MNRTKITLLALASMLVLSCTSQKNVTAETAPQEQSTPKGQNSIDRFADIEVLRYDVPGWNDLTLKEKEYVYYLSQAGYAGRDIIWDQNYKNNLTIRRALENIYQNYKGDKTTQDWQNFEIYLKRIWFANGIHHHYSNDKMKPAFSRAYLDQLLNETNTKLNTAVTDVLFNEKDSKKVNLDLSKGLVEGSAVNFYGEGITADEAERFYANMKSPDPKRALSTGLNSKLVKENGKLREKVWKSGGMYGSAIDQITYWLEKAKGAAENQKQANALALLIKYYKSGDLKTWDDYNVAWVDATEGNIDYINGFIEVYSDPLGHKGTYESIVQIKDFDMSKKMEVLSKQAQWFEDNSPLMPQHKKKNVVGVSYKTVIVASESGDASPSTPIGVNLPNADWIRAEHGSKSVSLGNIIDAYDKAAGSGRLKEFVNDDEELQLAQKYGELSSKLHTALHEVVGHASGQLNPGVGTPKETLKSYASTMEEGRADLVGLYFLYNPKLQELGLTDDWKGVGKAAYDNYIRNGLMMQLVRLEPGADIEESHMRNRQWVSAWVFEKGLKDNVIEKITRNGKTYFNITDYDKLHSLFGELLRETQRIKSEGDYNAARNLVENYGVKVDQDIHKEVLARNARFKEAAYRGFVNPYITPVKNASGTVTDYILKYPETFAEQMLRYSNEYSFLPDQN
ncbi:dihydrofolate reductase [Kaistella sp. PBT33-4]|uniref:dipeptidyl-peptidase 3 family protein n=1 Tax=Kaistella sp. PBT33-4 TaxID=3032000 RepID=UPI0023D8213C|nr:dihydrofolate reductase [Kaistella sp. PBT33-4]MDF0720520.1 dihydrofolate reductase [Kaistella sp. PBT33-4]